MKNAFAILASCLLLVSVMLERGGLSWEVERPVLHWLAKKTDHLLPSVTALIIPKNDPLGSRSSQFILESQDVALALRAILSFHPGLILVGRPLSDLTTGPLSLLREAQGEGRVQSISCLFASLPNEHVTYEAPDVFFLLSQPPLISVFGDVGLPGSFGFISLGEDNKELPSMPLFGASPDGHIISSLWWRGLHQIHTTKHKTKDSFESVFLIGRRMLLFPNRNVIWLGDHSCLKQKNGLSCSRVFLDDLLLRREEMERGQIKPDLELLFRNKTLLIGGAEAAAQGALLQDAQQQLQVTHLTVTFYALLLILFVWCHKMITRLSTLHVWLMLLLSIIFYAAAVFIVFDFFEILLPLLMPSSMLLMTFLKRRWS